MSQQEEALPQPSPGFRSGFVALVGRPNVGKSTLLNRLVGEKVAIVSAVPQTTRHRIQGVLTLEGRGQVAFLDTPGIHRPKFRMNRRMVATALDSLAETDVILFLVDAADGTGPGDQFVLQQIRRVGTPVVAAINKIDLVRKTTLLPLIDGLRRAATFRDIVPVSALDGTQCDVLRDAVLAALPEGPQLFPSDYLTDQPERFLAGELVREKILHRTRQEIPHAVAVQVDEYRDDGGLLRISATVIVEREGQKAILIGRDGSMLKAVGSEARQELERRLAARVHLSLWVRVERNWRQSAAVLDRVGVAGPEAPSAARGRGPRRRSSQGR